MGCFGIIPDEGEGATAGTNKSTNRGAKQSKSMSKSMMKFFRFSKSKKQQQQKGGQPEFAENVSKTVFEGNGKAVDHGDVPFEANPSDEDILWNPSADESKADKANNLEESFTEIEGSESLATDGDGKILVAVAPIVETEMVPAPPSSPMTTTTSTTSTTSPRKFKSNNVRGNKIAQRTAQLQQGYKNDATVSHPAEADDGDSETAAAPTPPLLDSSTSTTTSPTSSTQTWQAKKEWLQATFTPTGGGNMPEVDDVNNDIEFVPDAVETPEVDCQDDPYLAAYETWYRKGLIPWKPMSRTKDDAAGVYRKTDSVVFTTTASLHTQKDKDDAAGGYSQSNSMIVGRVSSAEESTMDTHTTATNSVVDAATTNKQEEEIFFKITEEEDVAGVYRHADSIALTAHDLHPHDATGVYSHNDSMVVGRAVTVEGTVDTSTSTNNLVEEIIWLPDPPDVAKFAAAAVSLEPQSESRDTLDITTTTALIKPTFVPKSEAILVETVDESFSSIDQEEEAATSMQGNAVDEDDDTNHANRALDSLFANFAKDVDMDSFNQGQQETTDKPAPSAIAAAAAQEEAIPSVDAAIEEKEDAVVADKVVVQIPSTPLKESKELEPTSSPSDTVAVLADAGMDQKEAAAAVDMDSFTQETTDKPNNTATTAGVQEEASPSVAAAVEEKVEPTGDKDVQVPSTPPNESKESELTSSPSVAALAAGMDKKEAADKAVHVTPTPKQQVVIDSAKSPDTLKSKSPIAQDDHDRAAYKVWNKRGLLPLTLAGKDNDNTQEKPEPEGSYQHQQSFKVPPNLYTSESDPMDEAVAEKDATAADEEKGVSSRKSESYKVPLEQFVFLKNTNRRIAKAPVTSWFGNSRSGKKGDMSSTTERNSCTGKKENSSEGLNHADVVSPRDRVAAYENLASTHKNYAKNRNSPEAAQERRQAFDRVEGAKSTA